jgi:hypothetical protein
MKDWRGWLLSLFLLLWPLLFVVGLFYLTGFPTQCDVDGCGPAPAWWADAAFFVAALGPACIAIACWGWWRIRRNRSAAGQIGNA